MEAIKKKMQMLKVMVARTASPISSGSILIKIFE